MLKTKSLQRCSSWLNQELAPIQLSKRFVLVFSTSRLNPWWMQQTAFPKLGGWDGSRQAGAVKAGKTCQRNLVGAFYRSGYLFLHVHSSPLLQGTTWFEHYSSIYYWTMREKRSNEGHCSRQWHDGRSKDLPLRHLLNPSYTHPKQPSICSVRAPGENKWKPDEPQQTGAINAWGRWEGVTIPLACWTAGFCSGWPRTGHLHIGEKVHHCGCYGALLSPWW